MTRKEAAPPYQHGPERPLRKPGARKPGAVRIGKREGKEALRGSTDALTGGRHTGSCGSTLRTAARTAACPYAACPRRQPGPAAFRDTRGTPAASQCAMKDSARCHSRRKKSMQGRGGRCGFAPGFAPGRVPAFGHGRAVSRLSGRPGRGPNGKRRQDTERSITRKEGRSPDA